MEAERHRFSLRVFVGDFGFGTEAEGFLAGVFGAAGSDEDQDNLPRIVFDGDLLDDVR